MDAEITIIGAGIGGLVTALQLHANGFKKITIYEAANQLMSLGVGINVQPHAVLVLRDLGLLPALQASGIETQELNYYDRFGNPIVSEPRGKFAGYAVPQFSCHRGELQMLLLAAVKERLGEEKVKLGWRTEGFDHIDENDRQAVKIQFVDRKKDEKITQTADLCIAADGINSTIRSILYPNEGPPHFSGRILWRGYLERFPFLTGASMVWSGHANQKFIAYPILDYGSESKTKSMVNWIAELRVRDENDPDTTPPAKADWLHSVPKERFAGAFKDWTFAFLNVPELIEKTEKVFEYPMCDRDPVERWSFGCLTLLGDAAHPMYPIGSNGASQAILDAACLTKHLLSNLHSIPSALKAYESDRLPATAKIVQANRGNGPDHVLQVAYERAPDGFKHINDVIPQDELDNIGLAYKAIAGFEIDKVNQLAEESEGTAERLGLKSPRGWGGQVNGVTNVATGTKGSNETHGADGVDARGATTGSS